MSIQSTPLFAYNGSTRCGLMGNTHTEILTRPFFLDRDGNREMEWLIHAIKLTYTHIIYIRGLIS